MQGRTRLRKEKKESKASGNQSSQPRQDRHLPEAEVHQQCKHAEKDNASRHAKSRRPRWKL